MVGVTRIETEILNVYNYAQKMVATYSKIFATTEKFDAKDSELLSIKWNTFLPETRKVCAFAKMTYIHFSLFVNHTTIFLWCKRE